MYFKKKPVIIEAFQMTREAHQDNKDWPEWLNEAWNKNHDTPGVLYPSKENPDILCIKTLEGTLYVEADDWIIKGVKGELYPCKPDIFLETYQLFETEEELNDLNGLDLNGYEVKLNRGSVVFAAEIPEHRGGGFFIQLTNKDGDKTQLTVSAEGFDAIGHLYSCLRMPEVVTARMKLSYLFSGDDFNLKTPGD